MPQGTITFHLSQGDPMALWLAMIQAHISYALNGAVPQFPIPAWRNAHAKAKHLAWMYWNKVSCAYARL